MSVAGSVAEIWRYPVKSMGGERLARSAIAVRGLHADRMWAVRDVELDTFTTARRWPILLQCSARFAADPAGRSAAAGDVLEVIVTFPAGREVSSSDPAIHDLLSELIGSRRGLSRSRRFRRSGATAHRRPPRPISAVSSPSPTVSHSPTSRCSRCASSPSWPLCHSGRGAIRRLPDSPGYAIEPARAGRALARLAVRRSSGTRNVPRGVARSCVHR
jgi:hypothetical protein